MIKNSGKHRSDNQKDHSPFISAIAQAQLVTELRKVLLAKLQARFSKRFCGAHALLLTGTDKLKSVSETSAHQLRMAFPTVGQVRFTQRTRSQVQSLNSAPHS